MGHEISIKADRKQLSFLEQRYRIHTFPPKTCEVSKVLDFLLKLNNNSQGGKL